MFLDFEKLEPKSRYKLITASIVPRPIALVTTRNKDGSTNAAPFSFFNVFSEDPPLVVLGLQTKPDKSLKDTTTNIRNTGEFVVNLVDDKMAEKMVGLVNANNLLQAARDQNLILQQEIDELRSGLANNTSNFCLLLFFFFHIIINFVFRH